MQAHHPAYRSTRVCLRVWRVRPCMLRRVLALGLLALAQTVAQTPRTFRARVKQVDITPPPGFPTGGHGPAGDIARGYWNRLHARAFYFDLGAGSSKLVLVSCDLFAMPLGLHRAVWQELVKR